MTEVFFRLVERRTDRKFAVPMQVDLPADATWQDFLRIAREFSTKAIDDAAKILAAGDSARSDAEYEHLLELARSDIAIIFPGGLQGTNYRIGAECDAGSLPAASAKLGCPIAGVQFSHAWWTSEVAGQRVNAELGVLIPDLEARFDAMANLEYSSDSALVGKQDLAGQFLNLLESVANGNSEKGLENARNYAVRVGLLA